MQFTMGRLFGSICFDFVLVLSIYCTHINHYPLHLIRYRSICALAKTSLWFPSICFNLSIMQCSQIALASHHSQRSNTPADAYLFTVTVVVHYVSSVWCLSGSWSQHCRSMNNCVWFTESTAIITAVVACRSNFALIASCRARRKSTPSGDG